MNKHEFAPLSWEMDFDEWYEKIRDLACDDEGEWY